MFGDDSANWLLVCSMTRYFASCPIRIFSDGSPHWLISQQYGGFHLFIIPRLIAGQISVVAFCNRRSASCTAHKSCGCPVKVAEIILNVILHF